MKSSGLAAVLSFFVMGLGQIYNGQLAKGLILVVLEGVLWLVFALTLGVGIIVFAPVWIWNIYDAYKTAESINLKFNSTESGKLHQ